jgi:transposase
MTTQYYSLGIDPAKGSFFACLLGPQGQAPILRSTEYPMSSDGFEALRDELLRLVPQDATLFAGIEATCALDDNLLHYFRNLSAPFTIITLRLDGAQTRRFSGATPVRGKTDRADAHRMASFTATYAASLSTFEQSPEGQTMACLANERLSLVDDIVRTKNRLRDYLVRIFPELERVVDNIFTPTMLALLRKAPTPAQIARMSLKSLSEFRAKIPYAHAVGEAKAKAILTEAKRSIGCQSVLPITLRHAIDQLELLIGQRREIDKMLEDMLNTAGEKTPPIISEARALTSIPGISTIVAVTITARARGISRFTSAKAFAAQLATHPCEDQTGTTRARASLSHRGDRRSRPLLFQAALCATSKNPYFAFYAWHHQKAGQTPKQAICSVMNRLARLCWKLAVTDTRWSGHHMKANIIKHHAEEWNSFITENPKWAKAVEKDGILGEKSAPVSAKEALT